jgi:hypothetical protein
MDEDMSPIFFATFLETGQDGTVGGDWTVLGVIGMFW